MKRFLPIIALALVMILAACGGSEPDEPQVVTVDYSFTSEFVYDPDTINVTEGTSVKINLDNSNSALDHSWVLVPAGVDREATAEDIEAQAIRNANSGSIVAGESGSVSFTAPEPGVYEFVCTIAGHLTGGMVGTMTVTE